ncbi:S4 domain-containing protein YaaA [Bacillus sp. FJAT-50079]|uniref:S4 domain-containing protein YaaA n=1 Tax=Bacillus sp. FJAT-50079 TaxID=2833577 RepID=UPI00201606D4|nr:S4 domain-containing protein YaaA [Bacillus sp. FJAT-50079]
MEKSENVETTITIDTETITLGQFLKLADIIQSGGMAKWFLSEHDVFINGEQDQRRGRKLKPEDKIVIPEIGTFIIAR